MQNEFYEHQSKLPNEDIVRIAYFELRKIKKEARETAKLILKERNIKNEHLQDYKNQIRKSKREERKQILRNKNEKYNILDFLLDLLFSG